MKFTLSWLKEHLDTGADAAFNAGGALTLAQTNAAVGDLPAATLGGTLAFKGASLSSDANIVAHSGTITLAGSNGVHVTGGSIDAGGGAIQYGSAVVHTGGGRISLDGGSGDVNVDGAATLDVSATEADAGTIKIIATTGHAHLDGKLAGSASGTDKLGGNFVFDVAALDADMSFGALNARLNDGGFSETRSFRVRNGDVALLETDAAITAHTVAVAADNGNIDIAGTIDASGSKGGNITLYAGEASAGGGQGNVHLASTARLLARATTNATSAAGSAGDGGRVRVRTHIEARGGTPAVVGITTTTRSALVVARIDSPSRSISARSAAERLPVSSITRWPGRGPFTTAGELRALLPSATIIAGRGAYLARAWTPLAKAIQRSRGNHRIGSEAGRTPT